ncbi:hypothetical protein CKM354_000463500 [Cercospora kikuchii]|uniref:Uncharacterized protein n=1 Tax=Cercospora kikuchii TaxID=84275 RepID=A0A9P3FBP0_9PEZI|nr:uncharacterized protein CKM354_000463500 [Cercospora kikuchii]GIZ41328.1 hypothetical protein CKM354_000463500 [Cercospora kikuchii]
MHKDKILLALGLAVCKSSAESSEPARQNANHIFNALHDSMRQWGSSLHHNGMSAFIANVPQGTQFYHGTQDPKPVEGTEWLAFEPEHALVFSSPRRRGPPPGGKGGHRHEDVPRAMQHDERRPQEHPSDLPRHDLKARNVQQPLPDQILSHTMAQRERARVHYGQERMDGGNPKSEDDLHGYLHAYRAKHDLRLLYLDGQSAAKSSLGTLDLQDVVLLHNSPLPAPKFSASQDTAKHRNSDHMSDPNIRKKSIRPKYTPGGNPFGDGYRAERLCAMANNAWNGNIDGFLRMEQGFEIILCSFKHNLVVDRISEVERPTPRDFPALGDHSLSYLQAVASRYDGIGGDRVALDYHDFITLYAFEDAVYFDKDNLPRANNDTSILEPVLKAIEDIVLRPHSTSAHTPNWQAVTDLVVSRYSDRIQSLAEGNYSDENLFFRDLENAVRPFIDYGTRSLSDEIERCATQPFSPLPLPADNTAAKAIFQVTTRLCTSLFEALDVPFEDAQIALQELQDWLGWSTFKRCRGCAVNEICFVPMWPRGTKDFHDQPRCIAKAEEMGSGYWGDFGGPHERPPPPPPAW